MTMPSPVAYLPGLLQTIQKLLGIILCHNVVHVKMGMVVFLDCQIKSQRTGKLL